MTTDTFLKLRELNDEVRKACDERTPESLERARTLLNQSVLILSQLSEEFKAVGDDTRDIMALLNKVRADINDLPKRHETPE